MGKKNSLIKNLQINREYILYYAKILLTNRVKGSFLGVLWLFLDPFMFMIVYTFVAQIIFGATMPYFPLYVFIGSTSWKVFAGTIQTCTTSIIRNKDIYQQIYFHKSVFPTIQLLVNFFEFMIAISLIVILMIFFGVPFTWHIFEFFLVIPVFLVITYGFALITAHVGVYFYDLHNILDFTLRFLFYMSPIFWSISETHPLYKYEMILRINPMYTILESFRNALLYGKSPNYKALLVITVVAIILIFIGNYLISKHEDEYARVI
jgi:ABC-type polysaccharide/polyol phosphate export permease